MSKECAIKEVAIKEGLKVSLVNLKCLEQSNNIVKLL